MPEFNDPVVQRIYEADARRIAEMKAEIVAETGDLSIIPMPFRCYGCDRRKFDLAMIIGDGLPMCVECLGFKPTPEMING